eukprot:921105_1
MADHKDTHHRTEIVDDFQEHENRDQHSHRIETMYSFFVETVSMSDLVTDIMVVVQFAKVEQIWPTSFMTLLMILPYLASYSIMCSFIVDQRLESIKLPNSSRQRCCNCKLFVNGFALILMTPAAIGWLISVDVLFLLYVVLSTIVLTMTCVRTDISRSDYVEHLLFKQLLGMSRMEVIGYRRLRTLSQLLFETLPAIIFQSYMVYYDNTKGGKQLNTTILYVSIAVALIYIIVVLLLIYLDARASKIPLTHYIVICLGARLNWVPFAYQIRTNSNSKSIYNFERVQFQPWFFVPFGPESVYRIGYEFTTSSIKQLGQNFANLPIPSSTDAPSNRYLSTVWLYIYKNHRLPVIRLGSECRSLDAYSFVQFLRSVDKKVVLDLAQVDWTRIIENTPNRRSHGIDVFLKRLCEEFINFADIKLITKLAHVVSFSTNEILSHIIDPSQRASFDTLLILKKYYDQNIHFGLSKDIMSSVYKIIADLNWIKAIETDPSCANIIFLLMWYTRRSICRHQCPNGEVRFSDDPKRKQFLSQYIWKTLPATFEVRYDPNCNSILSEVQWISMDFVKESQHPDGADVVNLTNEDDDHEIGFPVEFEILECFRLFQPIIESLLSDLTLRPKRINEYLQIGNKLLFKFIKKVFNKQSTDFLKLIINSEWNALHQFPIHRRFAELFCRMDLVVRRLEMVHGYGHYLLASLKYRQSTELLVTLPAHLLHIDIDIDVEHKSQFDKDNIMGISRIEIDFGGFKIETMDTRLSTAFDEYEEMQEIGQSMGTIQLFTVLQQQTQSVDDKLLLNKVILKEMSFEELLNSKDKKLIVDIFDTQILGMFRPIYIGLDMIEFMPLKLHIQPTTSTIAVTCDYINARITCLLRKLIDIDIADRALHQACTFQNLECIQFIDEYQDIFDCNAVNDHYESALHILCKMDDPDLEIFCLVLQLKDLDINQVRFDGKTAFEVLEANRHIDVEKKNEMLMEISAQPLYRPISQKVRNVLLIGSPNCGRHSLLKQLQIHYEKRSFSAWQKCIFRSKIIKYMVCSMKLLIKHCGEERIAALQNFDARRIYEMNTNNLDTMEHLDKESFESLSRLWTNPVIQIVFDVHGERLGLSDSVRYFLNRIGEISSHTYVPNELDILRAPHMHCDQIFASKSYRLDDFASDEQIQWIC